jgi:hypothetical protein
MGSPYRDKKVVVSLCVFSCAASISGSGKRFGLAAMPRVGDVWEENANRRRFLAEMKANFTVPRTQEPSAYSC